MFASACAALRPAVRRKSACRRRSGQRKWRLRRSGQTFPRRVSAWLVNPKDAFLAIEQRTSAVVAKGVTEIAAERGGTGGNHDDPAEMELVFGIGQKTCQQKRDLTGNGE